VTATEFSEAYLNSHKLAEGREKTGRKIFGCFCNYTPEEIIYAAGIIPIRIRGSSENIELADAHLPTFCCSFMRSALNQALRGKYSHLDGAVFPKTCDTTRALSSIWKRNVKLSFYRSLPVPGKSTDAALALFIEEPCLSRESLEKYTGNRITERSIKKAVKIYNENRSLVRELYNPGIPSLTFEGNMADPRGYDDAQVKAKIEAFIEILETRKYAKTKNNTNEGKEVIQ
jgi:benzoyl-CoA reductase subunit C